MATSALFGATVFPSSTETAVSAQKNWQKTTGLTIQSRKMYFQLGSYPTTDNYVTASVTLKQRAILCYMPAFAPPTSSDKAQLKASIQAFLGQGLQNPLVCLYNECRIGDKTFTAALCQAAFAYYAPMIHSLGLEVAFIGFANAPSRATSYLPAAADVDVVGVDLYDQGGYKDGYTLAPWISAAASVGAKFLVGEIGNEAGKGTPALTNADLIAYFGYLTTTLGPLATGGTPALDSVMWYQDDGKTGPNRISASSDFRIPYLQALAAALNAPPPVTTDLYSDTYGNIYGDIVGGPGASSDFYGDVYEDTYGSPVTEVSEAGGDLAVELLLGGTWQDVSGDSYHALNPGSLPTIKRGFGPEDTQATPAAVEQLRLANLAGKYTMENPAGPFYGQIGRNTPLRLSIPAASTFLRLQNDQQSYASCPDATRLDLTGNMTVRIDVTPASYVACTLASKWAVTSDQRSWWLGLNADGTLSFSWSSDGTTATVQTATSDAPIPYNGRTAVEVTLNVASGKVTFYTAPNLAGTFAQLGAQVNLTAAAVFNSSAPVTVGYNADQAAIGGWLGIFGQRGAWAPAAYTGFTGKVWEFRLNSGIIGSQVADPVFSAQPVGTTSFADAQANTWTLHGTAEISARDYRFHGEVPEWEPQWDPTGTDAWTDVTPSGQLRRLQQGTPPTRSSMTRGWANYDGPAPPVAWWPCEDGNNSSGGTPAITQLASGLAGGQPMTFLQGTPQAASDSSFICSQALPNVNGSTWWGQIPAYGGAIVPTAAVLRALVDVPSGGDTDTGTLLRMHTTGTCYRVELQYGVANNGSLQLSAFDGSGASLFASGYIDFRAAFGGVNGVPLYVSVELTTSGSNVHWAVFVVQPGSQLTALGLSGSISSATVGHAYAVGVNVRLANLLTQSAVGQISVQDVWESLYTGTMAGPLNAWAGEAAGLRFARLAAEDGFAARVHGPAAASAPMGQQGPDTTINLLQECEDADMGMVSESRDALALEYRTLASMRGQAPVSLPYNSDSAGGQSNVLGISNDDQLLVNDAIVTRGASGGAWTGSSYEATVTAGPLSTQKPPGGVGIYQKTPTVSLRDDGQLPHAAGWVTLLGTVNESRYPSVPLDLSGSGPLAGDLGDLNLGGFLRLTGPLGFMPPDPARMIIWGWEEQIGGPIWYIKAVTRPEAPYETLYAGTGTAATDAHCDTGGAALHAAYSATATSIQVDTTAGPIWTTLAADFPFDIKVAGERMTVTNITGSSSPQTFTVTRSVNGVAKAQASGAAVALFAPAALAYG